MPFTQAWYIKDHIVKVELYGELTAEEIAQSFLVSAKFLQETSSQRVHFIHDWTKIERYPTNLRDIHNSSISTPARGMEKLGWVTIYGAEQKLLRFIGDITFQLFQIRTHMTEDLDAAVAFLCRQDPALESQIQQQSLTEVSWYLPGHIIYGYDLIAADDMTQRNQNIFNLIEAEGKPPYVHLLIDFSSTNVEDYTSDIRELVHRSSSSKAFEEARESVIRHPLFGWVVVIGVHSRNIDIGGKIIARRYNYKRKEVDTLDDALIFLKQVDKNIARILNKQSAD